MKIDCYGDRADGSARMAGIVREPHGMKKTGGARKSAAGFFAFDETLEVQE